MKRSEPLYDLSALLQNTEHIDVPMSQHIQDEKLALEILSKLEELGMQPPSIKEPCETFVLYNGKYVKTEDSFMFTHKWDEE